MDSAFPRDISANPYIRPSATSALAAMPGGEGVSEWYARQIVFMTGVTGLLGKVVLHKLLSILPDLPEQAAVPGSSSSASPRVFVLVRPKPATKRSEAVSGRARFAKEVLSSPPLQALLSSRPSLARSIHVFPPPGF